jgi:hypothetical protein
VDWATREATAVAWFYQDSGELRGQWDDRTRWFSPILQDVKNNGYGPDGQGLIPNGDHTGGRAHPAPYPMRAGDKLAGADPSTLARVDVRNDGAIPPVPHTSLLRGA